MKLQEITIEDYGSFAGIHRFQLNDRGLVIVLGDNQDEPKMNSNGAGKSTLFDALDWALFGEVPRGDHVDSIVYERATGGMCRVEVVLHDDDDGSVIQIGRIRAKTSTVQLIVNNEDVTNLDTKETQKQIDDILGLDRSVFHAAVLFGQTDLFRFADSTSDAERMKVLTKILQLGDIDIWLDNTKEKRTKAEHDKESADQALVAHKAALEAAERELPTFEQNASAWENERAVSLRQAVVQLDEFRTSIAEHEKVVVTKPQVEANYQQTLTEYRHVVLDLSSFEASIKELRAIEATARGQAASCIAQGKQLNNQITEMQNLGTGNCTRCGQLISAEHVAKEVADLTVKRDELRANYSGHDVAAKQAATDAEHWEHEREKQRQAHYEADKENNRISQEAKTQLDQIAQSEAYLAKAKDHTEHLQKTMVDLQKKPNPWRERERVNLERIANYKAELSKIEEATTQADERIKYLDFWIQAFGPKGLKSYILDNKLQEMTDAANQWVKLITGGTIWIRFETQKKGRTTKALRNNFTTRVFRWNSNGSISERNYKSWSGGEKERVSLAIDFGLSRLIAKRAKKQYDILILDELFKHLDQLGREAVVEMLHELRKEKSSVFVIDHDSEFQGAFENVITIEKRNGQSKIVEDTHAEKQNTTPRQQRVPVRQPIQSSAEPVAF